MDEEEREVDEEFPRGVKRKREDTQDEHQPDSKRLKTEPHPAETPTTEEPYSHPEFIRHEKDITGLILSFLPNNERWRLRLVNRGWCRGANTSILSMDLSPMQWVPWGRRVELMGSQEPVFIDFQHCTPYYCVGLDNQGNKQWEECPCIMRELGGDKLHFFRQGSTKKVFTFKEIIFHQGKIFLWEKQGHSPLLCETSGEALWKTDELIFGNFKLRNPLKMNFNEIKMDLADFPHLQKLKLRGNTVMTDEDLMKAPQLSILKLGQNDVITNQSVACLTKLTALDLGWNKVITNEAVTPLTKLTILDFQSAPHITLKALCGLPNLQSVKFDESQEMGDFLQLPKPLELYVLDGLGNSDDPYSKQQMIYIAESLFSLIGKDEELSKHPALPALKSYYERRILGPIVWDALIDKRNTTYPCDFKAIRYSADDIQYIGQLTMAKQQLLNADAERGDQIANYEHPWEKSTEIFQIIIELIKITGKNLKIFVYTNDEEIGEISSTLKSGKNQGKS